MKKKDELLASAKTYKEFYDNYYISISFEQSIDTKRILMNPALNPTETISINIKFDESDFHHLTAIEKLEDLNDAPKKWQRIF